MAKIRPNRERVVVKKTVGEKTKSGIILPDTKGEKPQEGAVVAVGEGGLTGSHDGEREDPFVKVGDTVLYAAMGSMNIKVDGEDLVIMDMGGILAVIDQQETESE